MRRRIVTITFLLISIASTAAFAQNTTPVDPWASWRFLIGEWVSDGPKEQGTGAFSFALDLQEKILVRKNHADIPASKDRPAAAHDDLMVVYHGSGADTRAIYFDNEGHTINYTASFSKDSDTLTLVSEIMANAPRFRLTYIKSGKDNVKIAFEFAPPGKPDAFAPYLSGSAHKK